MKIRPLRTELFRADGRTDAKKLRVVLRSFASASNNYLPQTVKQSSGFTDHIESHSFSLSSWWSLFDTRVLPPKHSQ